MILPAFLLLAACSKESPKQSEPAVYVPTSLNFSKPATGPQLTDGQAQQIKATFKGKSMLNLPPGETVFPDKDTDPVDLAQQDAQLKQQDPDSYKMIMDLRKNCKRTHPNLEFDATFPTDDVTPENASDILQKGDKLGYSGVAGLTGASCPVNLTASTSLSAQVVDVNTAQKRVGAGGSLKAKMALVMKNPAYAQLLNARGVIVDTDVSGLEIHRAISAPRDDAYAKFVLQGSYLSLKADIPYSIDVKVLSKGTAADLATETVATAVVKFSGFATTVVTHSLTNAVGDTQTEYFVNGRPMTEAQINSLFGDNVPGSSGQVSSVTQGLVK